MALPFFLVRLLINLESSTQNEIRISTSNKEGVGGGQRCAPHLQILRTDTTDASNNRAFYNVAANMVLGENWGLERCFAD